MGIDTDFGGAYIKSQIAAGQKLPIKGNVFISVMDKDKKVIEPIVRDLVDMGFHIYATSGTATILQDANIPVKVLPKIADGRPNIIDLMKDGKIQLVINTPSGRVPRRDEVKIRSHVITYNIPYTTTISGAHATVLGIKALASKKLSVISLQEYHELEAEKNAPSKKKPVVRKAAKKPRKAKR